MNILIVNHFAYRPADGAGIRHWRMAKEFSAAGHRVEVASCTYLHKSRKFREDVSRIRCQTVEQVVRYRWLCGTPYGSGLFARGLNMAVFACAVIAEYCRPRRRRSWDVVIGSSPDPLAALSAYFVARLHRSAYIYEVRDLWPDTLVRLGSASDNHPLVRLLYSVERFLYRRADAVVSVLPRASRYFADRYGHGRRVHWVPNGSDVSDPPPPPNDSTSIMTAVYLGAHGPANGLDVLIDAVRIVGSQRLQVLFVGSGTEKARLEMRAAELELANVHFKAPVPRSQVADVLAEADVCLLPIRRSSLYDYGYSMNKLFDYMAAARPIVIATDSPYNPVDEARCGWTCQPDDSEDFASALREALNESATDRREKGRRARVYLESNHDLGALSRRMLRLCVEAAGGCSL